MSFASALGKKIMDLGNLASRRELTGFYQKLFSVIAVAFSLFFLYNAGPSFLGSVPDGIKRGIFMLLLCAMIILKYPLTPRYKKVNIIDIIFILLTVFVFGYWVIEFNNLMQRLGSPTKLDLLAGAIAIIISFEVARRVLGIILPIIGSIFIFYAVIGDMLGVSILSTASFPWSRIVSDIYSLNGIFGMVLDVTMNFIALFVIFGSLMQAFGADAFFIEFPYALTCGMTGGPAKTAVVASCLFGSISGSATANTAATGAFTIPLMIRTGYPREIAGAIEPAASTGGMFMPPVMGAATFIMAEMLRVPYSTIVKVCIVPAIIYFFSVYMAAHYQALATKVPVIPKDERPNPIKVF